MRQIVLDTETTGLEVSLGHRVIEIGCIELVDRRVTGNHWHHYFNPEREIDAGAYEVHGISNDFLRDKPRFVELADELYDYLKGAELVIHNAAFDVGFLDNEFHCAGLNSTRIASVCAVIDTLPMAREIHPGQRNSLDALCKRYSVDNSGRDFHGALLDAQLLADVYLAMTGGQGALSFDRDDAGRDQAQKADAAINRSGLELVVVKATDAELAAHTQQLDLIEKNAENGVLWRKLDG